MIGTRQLVRELTKLGLREHLAEHRIRRLIRDGRIRRPGLIAGIYVWTKPELKQVTQALGIDLDLDALLSEHAGQTSRDPE